MKRFLAFLMMIGICIGAQSLAGAAISAAGGTEDFESLGLADNTRLTAGFITGWEAAQPGNAADGLFFDNTDTGAFTTAAGVPAKPAGAGVIRWNRANAAGAGNFIRMRITNTAVAVDGRDVTWKMYWARSGAVSGGPTFVGVNFPNDPSNTGNRIGLEITGTTQDAAAFCIGQVHTSNSDARVHIGSGAADNNDYALSQWNLLEVHIVSSTTSTGTAEVKHNGTSITTFTIKQDTSELYRYTSPIAFMAPFATNMPGSIYLDDATATLPPPPPLNTVEDWMRFFK